MFKSVRTKTLFLLLAQYGSVAVIPVKRVSRDYFDLSAQIFLRKVRNGEIVIPVLRMGTSQKANSAIHISDLAAYIDHRRNYALREIAPLQRRAKPDGAAIV